MVYVTSQLTLLAFVAIRSFVAKTSSRTIHQVSAAWLRLIIPESVESGNGIIAIYEIILFATLLLIRLDKLRPRMIVKEGMVLEMNETAEHMSEKGYVEEMIECDVV